MKDIVIIICLVFCIQEALCLRAPRQAENSEDELAKMNLKYKEQAMNEALFSVLQGFMKNQNYAADHAAQMQFLLKHQMEKVRALLSVMAGLGLNVNDENKALIQAFGESLYSED